MSLTRCDACGSENKDQTYCWVYLNDLVYIDFGPDGKAPDNFHVKHFCNLKCFWDWARKEMPPP